MSKFYPHPIEGHIVPGIINPNLQYDFTTSNHHAPIKKEIHAQAPPVPIQNLGDERHHELISAIKGLKVGQNVTQIQQALPQHRDWRN